MARWSSRGSESVMEGSEGEARDTCRQRSPAPASGGDRSAVREQLESVSLVEVSGMGRGIRTLVSFLKVVIS